MLNRIKLPMFLLSMLVVATGAVAQSKPDYLRSTISVLVALKYSTIDPGQYRSYVVPVIAKPSLTIVTEPVEQIATQSAPTVLQEDLSRFFRIPNNAVADVPALPEVTLENAVVAAVNAQNSISLPRGPIEQAILSVLNPPSRVIYLVAPFDEYTVQRGDTLIQIAANQYDDAELVSRILSANFNAIYNPNIIIEGQVIRLPRQ